MRAPSMDQFVAKTRLQRRVLNAVNSRFGEPLLDGLSTAAIDRWAETSLTGRRKLSVMLYRAAEWLSPGYDDPKPDHAAASESERDIEAIIARIDQA